MLVEPLVLWVLFVGEGGPWVGLMQGVAISFPFVTFNSRGDITEIFARIL
jgi:hypothetical protein